MMYKNNETMPFYSVTVIMVHQQIASFLSNHSFKEDMLIPAKSFISYSQIK